MKIQSLQLIASLLLVGGINSSCNSCNDKKDPQIDSTTQQVTVTDTTNSGYQDVASERNGIANSGMNAVSGSTASRSSASNLKSGSNEKGKKGDKRSGYSAPDGTDAENHDGDQYTRNDTTHMPGGSIK